MRDFQTVLSYVNEQIYQPNGLIVSDIQEESQNAKYAGGIFCLSSKTVRFRVANITPTKVGQFVAFWQKDRQNKNQPYTFETAPDLLVITTFRNDEEFGQFVFPKDVLLKEGILSSDLSIGKMAIRVYPRWDSPLSKQAIKSQQWQLNYFIDSSDSSERIKDLYS